MEPSNIPPYLRIAVAIRERIARGDLGPGDRLPSTREIVREWGVAMATATKVLAVLKQQGHARPVPGRGTVVAGSGAGTQPRPVRADFDDPVLNRIVGAAIDIADTDGRTGLSMRRIAATLDMATMSLYRHVPNRGALVELMIDAVFREEPLPELGAGHWRAHLDALARTQWAIYHRHPWLASSLSLTRPQRLPNAMAHTESVLRVLRGHDLASDTRLRIAMTLFGYVRGVALNLERESIALRYTGAATPEEVHIGQWSASVNWEEFPELRNFRARPIDLGVDAQFDFGLERVLDGIHTLVESGPRGES